MGQGATDEADRDGAARFDNDEETAKATMAEQGAIMADLGFYSLWAERSTLGAMVRCGFRVEVRHRSDTVVRLRAISHHTWSASDSTWMAIIRGSLARLRE